MCIQSFLQTVISSRFYSFMSHIMFPETGKTGIFILFFKVTGLCVGVWVFIYQFDLVCLWSSKSVPTKKMSCLGSLHIKFSNFFQSALDGNNIVHSFLTWAVDLLLFLYPACFSSTKMFLLLLSPSYPISIIPESYFNFLIAVKHSPFPVSNSPIFRMPHIHTSSFILLNSLNDLSLLLNIWSNMLYVACMSRIVLITH